MRARALSVWEGLSASYWFLPSVMAVAAAILSHITLAIDRSRLHSALAGALYTHSPEGARELLGVIAGSMLGVAGVVFSITIVAMALAAGQFGPRLLRNFMRDRGNQVTLGTFLAGFVYCLLVLRQVGAGEADSTPDLSMHVAMLMALAGLGVLIFFIHHVAESIQAPHVIAAVARDLRRAIDELYPEELGDQLEDPPTPADLPDLNDPDAWAAVPTARSGYVQRIEAAQVIAIARERDMVVCIDQRPGRYVQPGDAVMRLSPRERADGRVVERLRRCFTVNSQRTLSQDPEFAVRQLVEVAVRALSLGANDPFTALQCIDALGDAISRLASRRIPSPWRADAEGRLRVIAPAEGFTELLDASCDQVRQYAGEAVDVLNGQLVALERIARRVRRPADRRAVAEHAAATHAQALAAATTDRQRREADQRLAQVHAALAPSAAAPVHPRQPAAAAS